MHFIVIMLYRPAISVGMPEYYLSLRACSGGVVEQALWYLWAAKIWFDVAVFAKYSGLEMPLS